MKCFPAHTRIQTSLTTSVAISTLRTGDIVLSYDARANKGRGALVPRRVVRIYRNTTTEWLRLTWVEGGEPRALVTTPGHHFLDQFGQFPTIAEMTRTGRATVVLASGELAAVTAERIVYSAETAHLFERAVAQGAVAGNAAAQPVELDAWATYNFEVEDLHTYVAEGVRVHNDSGWLGAAGTALFSSGDDGRGWIYFQQGTTILAVEDRRVHEGLLDTIGDGFSNFAHGVGTAVNEVIDGVGGALESAAKAAVNGLNSIFGPGGNSNTAEQINRTSWTDQSGQTHWGSMRDLRLAEEAGKVGSSGKDHNSKGTGSQSFGIGQDSYSDRQKATASQSKSGASKSGQDDSGDYKSWKKPVLLDLDGNGVSLAELGRSTVFLDSDGDGLKNRTAWAGVGDGVLFYDAGNDGQITEGREFVFTEWDPTAKDDMAALRSRFDSNGDGKLTSADAEWGSFKVMVTGPDGMQSAPQDVGRAFIAHLCLIHHSTRLRP